MRGFISKHASLKRRGEEYTDRGYIIMTNKQNVTQYYKLFLEKMIKCDILKVDSNFNVIQESMKLERVY